MSEPSEDTLIMLASLQKAVSNALERKRRLGQYAVVWEDNRVVYLGGESDPGRPVDGPVVRENPAE